MTEEERDKEASLPTIILVDDGKGVRYECFNLIHESRNHALLMLSQAIGQIQIEIQEEGKRKAAEMMSRIHPAGVMPMNRHTRRATEHEN